MDKDISPIFIIGSPRSGTTMLGNLIGSASDIVHVGELASLYFAHWVAEREYQNVPSNFKDQFLSDIKNQAQKTLLKICDNNSVKSLVEDTPWNFRIISVIEEAFPQATFVVNYRNPNDVVASMRKSYEAGYKWAGPSDNERAKLWLECYSEVKKIKTANRIDFDYDKFLESPTETMDKLSRDLEQKGLPFDIDYSIVEKLYAQTSASPAEKQGSQLRRHYLSAKKESIVVEEELQRKIEVIVQQVKPENSFTSESPALRLRR